MPVRRSLGARFPSSAVRALTAAAVLSSAVGSLVVAAGPASAVDATVSCTVTRSRLSIGVAGATYAGLRTDGSGYIVVDTDPGPAVSALPCRTSLGTPIAASDVTNIDIAASRRAPFAFGVMVDHLPGLVIDVATLGGDRLTLTSGSGDFAYDLASHRMRALSSIGETKASVGTSDAWPTIDLVLELPGGRAAGDVNVADLPPPLSLTVAGAWDITGSPAADNLIVSGLDARVDASTGDDAVTFLTNGYYRSSVGDGADVVAGPAVVEYTGGPVNVSLDGVANDGHAGEGDNIVGSVWLMGTAGDDVLVGDSNHNILEGGGGDDRLVGGGNASTLPFQLDRLRGGEGDDTVVPGGGAVLFDAGTGQDVLDLSELPTGVTFDGTAETLAETVIGTPYSDSFTVSGLVVRPGPGGDTVELAGGATFLADGDADGPDAVTGEPGTWADYSERAEPLTVTLDGSPDDGSAEEGDNLVGTSVAGGDAADVLVGSNAAQSLHGGAGDDRLVGRSGDDRLEGGPGVDVLIGSDGADLLLGESGADRLAGGAGTDDLRGDGPDDAFADSLDGGFGDDDEHGGAGPDTFRQGAQASDNGSDLLDGGAGADTVTYLGRAEGVVLSPTGTFDDGAEGEGDHVGPTIERLYGTDRADVLTGGAGPDVLAAYGGADTLTGGGGADRLVGGTGNDRFHARDGVRDTLEGGSGTDSSQHDEVDVRTLLEIAF